MPRNRKKTPYDATLRFRGPSKLQERIDRIIEKRGYGSSADFMREGMSKLVVEEERRLELPPLPDTPLKRVRYTKPKAQRKRR